MRGARRALLFSLFLIVVSPPGARAESGHHDGQRGGCAHCNGDGPQVASRLKQANLLYAQFKPKEAIVELLKVLEADPRNLEALAMLSRAHIDVGDMIPESTPEWQEKRMREYAIAEEYARKAAQADPYSTWSHFYVAASLGKIAVLSPVAKQVDLAGHIREAIERSIALDPQNGFAYHVYGVWHRKMAEIGRMSRAFATVVLWRSIPKGTMEQSIEYLKRAIALNPAVIASRLELAKSYIATGQWPLARRHLKSIDGLPIRFSDDSAHKIHAGRLLEEIKDR